MQPVNKFQGIVGEHFVFLEETNNIYISIETIKVFIKYCTDNCKSANLDHLKPYVKDIAITALEAFSEGLILELDKSEHKLRQSVTEQLTTESN